MKMGYEGGKPFVFSYSQGKMGRSDGFSFLFFEKSRGLRCWVSHFKRRLWGGKGGGLLFSHLQQKTVG